MKLKHLLKSITLITTVVTPVAFTTACFGGGGGDTKDEEIKVQSITATTSSNSVSINNNLTFFSTVSPSNATNKTVEWTSSNTNVAEIDANGKLTAKAEGTTVVTAKAKDGSNVTSNSVTITVYLQEVTKVTVYEASVVLGGTTAIYAACSPTNASYPELTYDTGNHSIATIDSNGYITGVSLGETTVTATNEHSGLSATAKLTVVKNEIKVTSISIPAVGAMGLNDKVQLNPTVLPSNATNKALIWSSSNSSVASVDDNGLVTANALGTAVIKATSQANSSVWGSVSISVTDNSLPVETWKQYIYNRTFSLCGRGTNGTCWGTGWILSDATPSDSTDYTYWIATNFHVQKGIEQAGAYPNSVYFGCSESTSGLNYQTDYVPFGSGNYTAESQIKFTYDGSTKITTEGYDDTEGSEGWYTRTGLKGIDFYVAKANFTNVTSSSYTASSKSIAKNKLDALNKFTAAGQPITQFADNTDSVHWENKKLYTGGYPVNSSWRATWEYHDLNSEGIPLAYYTNSEIEYYDLTHWTVSNITNPVTDCAPLYICDDYVIPYGTSWMDGGASGSMLIGNFGTDLSPIWKVVAIYWGVFTSSDENAYYTMPSYTVFKSNWKDFVSSYITI